jgi:hypothetical protein
MKISNKDKVIIDFKKDKEDISILKLIKDYEYIYEQIKNKK